MGLTAMGVGTSGADVIVPICRQPVRERSCPPDWIRGRYRSGSRTACGIVRVRHQTIGAHHRDLVTGKPRRRRVSGTTRQLNSDSVARSKDLRAPGFIGVLTGVSFGLAENAAAGLARGNAQYGAASRTTSFATPPPRCTIGRCGSYSGSIETLTSSPGSIRPGNDAPSASVPPDVTMVFGLPVYIKVVEPGGMLTRPTAAGPGWPNRVWITDSAPFAGGTRRLLRPSAGTVPSGETLHRG